MWIIIKHILRLFQELPNQGLLCLLMETLLDMLLQKWTEQVIMLLICTDKQNALKRDNLYNIDILY